MNIIKGFKTGSKIAFGVAVNLLEMGAWASANNFTQTQFRDRTTKFNREIGDGIKHAAHNVAPKLKVIKRK